MSLSQRPCCVLVNLGVWLSVRVNLHPQCSHAPRSGSWKLSLKKNHLHQNWGPGVFIASFRVKSQTRHISHIDVRYKFSPKSTYGERLRVAFWGRGKFVRLLCLTLQKILLLVLLAIKTAWSESGFAEKKCISLVSSWGQHFWWSIKHIRNSTLSHKFFLPIKYKASLWH